MGADDFILDGMRWSFSSVSSYNQCPQGFKYGYIDALPKVGNAFSDWGSYMHSILERYFKGELEFFELSQVYVNQYTNNIQHKFPPNRYCNLEERYYLAGINYLDKFDGILEDYSVIGVELKVKLNIGGFPFVGVIDLLLEKDGEYVIVDHKSKGAFKSKKELREYARQLYLYSNYVFETYGKWPKTLIFHMIRNNGELVKIDFMKEDCIEASNWFVETIKSIYKDATYLSRPNQIRERISHLKESYDRREIKFRNYIAEKKKLEAELKKTSFFCWQLCGVRKQCPDADKGPKDG